MLSTNPSDQELLGEHARLGKAYFCASLLPSVQASHVSLLNPTVWSLEKVSSVRSSTEKKEEKEKEKESKYNKHVCIQLIPFPSKLWGLNDMLSMNFRHIWCHFAVSDQVFILQLSWFLSKHNTPSSRHLVVDLGYNKKNKSSKS